MDRIFNADTPKEAYEELYQSQVGDVFEVEEDDYETVMERINEYLPPNRSFETFPINPGTDLYTMYGPGHCVVTLNEIL